MRRFLFAFSVLLLCSVPSNSLFAQKKFSGVVQDEKDKLKLENATIMLLHASDSIMVDFARSDKDGRFSIQLPDTGTYLIISSYPKYGDFYSVIDTKNDYSTFNIEMSTKAQLLEEAIVIGRIPIVVKGDTTEYDAGSFTVEKNAKVEDLLKVLPGISVDASGKITAQGKTVEKVLVDGEEFFGNDPKLVTRNIRSDMVDKVQVYDKKSEDAERTGVDDGQKVKTINVKLKEDKKNGIFGKALAGGGTDDYYMGQLMFNKFKGSQKIAAFGLFGNNASTSLSWQDYEKYGESDNVSYSDDGGQMYSFGGGGDDFSGEGVIGRPKAINSGLMFSDKTKDGKHKLNLSYKYGKIEHDGTESTFSQNNLQDGVQYTNANRDIAADKDRQKFNLKYDLQFDSLTSLMITGNASRDNIWNSMSNNSTTLDRNLDSLNTSRSIDISNRKVESLNARALFTRKFLKKGRSITLGLSINNNESDGGGSLSSNTRIFEDGLVRESLIVDQRKKNEQQSTTKGGSLSYTEPLTSELNLTLNYSLTRNDNSSLSKSFNKNEGTGEYDILDPIFSNDYDFNRTSNGYRVALNLNNDKIWANLTNNLNNDRLHQQNNSNSDKLTRSFLTYNPSLSMSYKLSSASNIYFNYSGRNQLPSLSQIQPLRNNQDPINEYLGNENLKPSFTNSFNVNYNSSKLLTGSYKYIGGYFQFNKNALIQNIDSENGLNKFKWDNLKDHTNFSWNVWGGYSFKLSKKLNISNGPRVSINSNKNFNTVNEDLNEINSTNYTFGYNFSKSTTKGVDFNLMFSPGYQQMTSSLQPDQRNNGFIFNSNGSVSYYLPAKIKFYVDYNYVYQAGTDAMPDNFEQFLVHPGISKKFLKNESLALDFVVNDLFNKNTGFSRSVSNTFFTERRSDTIRRYYMLKVSWDFTKMFVN